MELGAFQKVELRALAMTAQLRKAIGLLKYNNTDLTLHVTRLAAGNPAISVLPERPESPPKPPAPRPQPPQTFGGGNGAAEAMMAQPEDGLQAHVLHQIGMAFRDPSERAIAEAFAAALEPSGWLRGTAGDIARDQRCDNETAEAILARLQDFEPTGIFARDLAECLRLQARERGLLTPQMETVLDHLDLLARGAFDTLAQLAATSEEDITRILQQLRSFDPKPGAAFDSTPAPIRPPDLIVTQGDAGHWQVDLNHATTPRLSVREPDSDALPDAAAREQALAEARWLERAVSRRNASTLKIAMAVVERQANFLRDGPASLKPLSFADVAAATGLHESTVSRVVAGLMVATPRGTCLLRDFFSVSLGGRGEHAATAVRHEIARMVRAEDPAQPLSDTTIVRQLRDRDIELARRTVAKYRALMGIAPASVRRKRPGKAATR